MRGVMRIPAMPASIEPRTQDTLLTVSALIPSSWLTWRSSATARMATPRCVRRKKAATATVKASVTAMIISCSLLKKNPWNVWVVVLSIGISE